MQLRKHHSESNLQYANRLRRIRRNAIITRNPELASLALTCLGMLWNAIECQPAGRKH